MLTFSLALRNVTRNRERSLLTLIGVLLAIGSFVALVSLAEGLGNRFEQELDDREADIYVVPHASLALPSGPIGTLGYSQDTINPKLRETIATQLNNCVRCEGVVRASWSGRKTSLPVLFMERDAIAAFFPRLQGLPGELQVGQVVLGSGLARQEFGSQVADTLQHGQSKLPIVGVVRGPGFQDYFAFTPPDSNNNGYHELWIQLRDRNLADGDVSQIRAWIPPELEVLTKRSYLARTHSYVRYAWLLQASVASIGVLIAVTASMNTMLMSTYERLREFAVLRAIGASRATVAAMLIWESLMLANLGGLLGCLFGVLASGVLDQAVVFLFQLPFPLAKVTPTLLLEGMLLSSLVGVLGALIPVILIWRQKIMDGLRSE